LAPNWENMIKSRTVIIEDAVKKIFGEHMTISFKSKINNIDPIDNKNKKSDKGNNIRKQVIKSSEYKNVQPKNNNLQVTDSEKLSSEAFSENSIDKEKKSSKNLADFFNGQIIDTEQE